MEYHNYIIPLGIIFPMVLYSIKSNNEFANVIYRNYIIISPSSNYILNINKNATILFSSSSNRTKGLILVQSKTNGNSLPVITVLVATQYWTIEPEDLNHIKIYNTDSQYSLLVGYNYLS